MPLFKREVFNPARDFVARKSFTCKGVKYEPGDVFDHSVVDERRLRQMYDYRMLSVRDSSEAKDSEVAHQRDKVQEKSPGLLANLGLGV